MEISFFKFTLAVLFGFLIISVCFSLPGLMALLSLGCMILFITIIIIKFEQEEENARTNKK